MRQVAVLVFLVAAAFLVGGCFWPAPSVPSAAVGRAILLPLYIYPMWWDPALYAWPRVAAAAAAADIWAIINPASGPGGPPNADYQQGLADLGAAGVTMLGYVWTDYGARPLADVKADVDTYADHFLPLGLTGIFYDGVSSSASWLPYYEELQAYARSRGFRWVVLNPGTTIDEAYLYHGVGDVIVIFEGSYGDFLTHAFPAYVARYPQRRFAVLVKEVPSLAEAEDVLQRTPFAGFVHCTHDAPPNEWDELPPYWEDWAAWFERYLYYVRR